MEEVTDLEELVKVSDLILSVIPPSQAIELARQVAGVLKKSKTTYFADCNAVSPQTVRTIDDIITAAGGASLTLRLLAVLPAEVNRLDSMRADRTLE